MFETEIDEDFSFLAFFVQLLGVFIPFILWGQFGVDWMGSLPLFRHGGLVTAAGNIVWGLTPGFFLGCWGRARDPRNVRPGGYIWLVPVGLMAWALASGALNSTLARDLRDMFYPVQENGLDGFVVVLFTIPTLGCVGYSFGIWFQGRYPSQRKID